MVDVGVFHSVGEGISATHFVQASNCYLFENCTDQDDERSTELFLLFLDGRTEKWAEAQPDNVKNLWKVLKPAFLACFQLDETSIESPQAHYNAYFDHLKPQIAFLHHCQEWDEWLCCLLKLLMDVLSEMVMQWGLAHTAWMSLPSELQTAIPQLKKGVIEFINTCKSIPWLTYKHILDEHDQWEEVIKEIRHCKQHDMEIHWELKNELQCDLATSIEEQVCKALDSLCFQTMPVSPPMQQDQLSPPQMCQLPALPVRQPLTPPHDIAQFTEIAQQTFPDTPQGKMNYEAALHDFKIHHPFATIQLPKDEPYPLTPGTLPARSNECHHCGQHGHRQVACINGVVPQPEQNYRQAYGAASYQACSGNA
ncbi:uncharacterized protein UBRO_20595 [Ustilago bromivora]|uniref:CCHC-type domain-containing protein n=1 Tax=Ustilago bromivora TaxID=307758 RepID=A0A1K0H560_9BASI|nr:uncharacterized protein UBRO_20595 [Ustilago bromivora]SYW80578.1 uncharacterized protein UBRO2_03846 [Ustilago bromivora]